MRRKKGEGARERLKFKGYIRLPNAECNGKCWTSNIMQACSMQQAGEMCVLWFPKVWPTLSKVPLQIRRDLRKTSWEILCMAGMERLWGYEDKGNDGVLAVMWPVIDGGWETATSSTWHFPGHRFSLFNQIPVSWTQKYLNDTGYCAIRRQSWRYVSLMHKLTSEAIEL